MSKAASREIKRSHVISIQREVSVQKASGCIIICHGQNVAAFQQGLTSLRRHVQVGELHPNVLFSMICVGCLRTKVSLIISFFSA